MPQLYDSLKRQTSLDFCWLIVDDGSTDYTQDIVESWIQEGLIDILYYYQENGGKERAHNYGAALTTTELFMCCDSDDYLTDDAVAVILKRWQGFGNKSDDICGIIGPRAVYNNGIKIKGKIPHCYETMKYRDFTNKIGKIKETFVVLKTNILRENPYPVQKGERFIPIGFLYHKLDQHYVMLTIEQELMICNYLSDGETKNGVKWFVENPKGMAISRNEMTMREGFTFKGIKGIIDYIAASLIAKKSFSRFVSESNAKVMTLILLPLGIIRSRILIKKYKKMTNEGYNIVT